MGRLVRVAALAVGLLWLVGCQAEGGERFVSEEDHFSIREMDGWTVKRDRGAAVFAGAAELGLGHNTIAIRSAPLQGDWVEDRTVQGVTLATAKVLEALPKAQVEPSTPVVISGFRGARFDLSFEPRSKKGQRYARRHVVLVGKRRLYHIVHTAPEGDLQYTAEVFDAVVSSLNEEAQR